MEVTDNDAEWNSETLKVSRPFYTTRTRDGRIGTPFLIQNAEQSGAVPTSRKGSDKVTERFDRANMTSTLGDILSAMLAITAIRKKPRWCWLRKKRFDIARRDREAVEGLPLRTPRAG